MVATAFFEQKRLRDRAARSFYFLSTKVPHRAAAAPGCTAPRGSRMGCKPRRTTQSIFSRGWWPASGLCQRPLTIWAALCSYGPNSAVARQILASITPPLLPAHISPPPSRPPHVHAYTHTTAPPLLYNPLRQSGMNANTPSPSIIHVRQRQTG